MEIFTFVHTGIWRVYVYKLKMGNININLYFARIISCVLLFNIINGEIINKNVETNLDLTSQLIKTTRKITVEDSAGEPIKSYILTLKENNVSYIKVKDGSNNNINLQHETSNGLNNVILTFGKASPIQTIHLETVSSGNILPYPEQIKQNDKQFVKYVGTMYFFSMYKTATQSTTVKLSSSNILSHTQVKPFTVSSNVVSLGPYYNIEAFDKQELIIHYENQTPFLTVNNLERTIEVSHWGNIAIKESIQISHTGAKLMGSFSRYDFQKDGRLGQSAVRSYKTFLPASATGVYYRDTNGNISTSNMNVLHNFIDLELRPRFPLFGGWKTQYTLGYNVPTYEYLFNSGNKYQLQMRLIDHIHDNMAINEANVNIILPEGAANIELILPYSIKRRPNSLIHTYLDTVGRPIVSFSKSNLVESHISDFTLKYTFSKVSLLQEPLLVIAFIYVIFLLTIMFLRLDFSITAYKEYSNKDN